jgi:hypothetical protein
MFLCVSTKKADEPKFLNDCKLLIIKPLEGLNFNPFFY